MSNADRRVSLSPRERKILDLAALGHTDSEVALKLDISVATVSTYWGRVRMKLGPHNRAELVARHVQDRAEVELEELRRVNRELAGRLLALSEGPDGDHGTRLFRKALVHVPEGILLVTETGLIQMASDSAAELFGYEPPELEGQPISLLISECRHERHAQYRSESHSNPEKMTMDGQLATRGVHKNGRELPIVVSLSEFDIDGSTFLVCSLRSLIASGSNHVSDSNDIRVG